MKKRWLIGGALLVMAAAPFTIPNVNIQGGVIAGADTSSATITAPGSTTARTAAAWHGDIVNVKAWGAKGDGLTLRDGACSASSTAFASASASFSAADVGKTIVIHGAGSAGSPVQTTIASVIDSHDVVLAAACQMTVAGATYQYATDDTAAITAAVAAANNRQVYFPAGKYALVSQSSPISLSSFTFRGDGIPSAQNGYDFASQIWIFNQSTPAFQLGNGFNWLHLGVFYPLQDGSPNATFTGSVSGTTLTVSGGVSGTIAVGQQLFGSGVTSGITIASGSGTTWTLSSSPGAISSESMATYAPIAYPATFHADSVKAASNDNFEGYNFVNPYDLFSVDATSLASGAGRITFGQGMGYCLHSCFYLTEGIADVIAITRASYWAVGADSSLNGGNQYAPKWTASFGEFAHFDVGSATKATVDGFTLAPNIVHGYRYLVRVISGVLSGVITPTYSDGIQTTLSVEGSGSFDGTLSIPGWVYTRNPYDGATNAPAISLTCTGANTALNIVGTYFKNSVGNIVDNSSGSCIQTLTETGNTFHAWGQSSTTSTYYANLLGGGSATKFITISGNMFQGVAAAPSIMIGVALTHANGSTIVSNNVFQQMNFPIWDASSDAGTIYLDGNTSVASSGTSSVRVTGTHTPTVLGNAWDKPSLATITSGFGTSPGAITGTAWYAGRLTVGTGGSSSGVISWPWTMPRVPICSAQDETTGAAIQITPTTTGATLTGTMAANDNVSFQCQAM